MNNILFVWVDYVFASSSVDAVSVPRIGDRVDLHPWNNGSKWIQTGRVVDVIWIYAETPQVTVVLKPEN